ncbi:MAG TPA: hypothetical protein ENO14_02980, partial [Chromatiales bacterium]|nr:hypothetical protein [Chromatiales bacterium]
MGDIAAHVMAQPPSDDTFPAYADNVVANYLVYHAIAIRCAEESVRGAADNMPRTLPGHTEWIERALVYEAVALGYLADAFSSSHLLTPVHLPMARLQDANVRAAHEFFATQGAYVSNSMGDVWRTFGDGLMTWYGPAYEYVLDACTRSAQD